jgi:hypothetical protein
VEAAMNPKAFSLTAGVVFLLIALGHVLRVTFDASFVVQDFSVPMWVSWIVVVITGYLAYEGFRLAGKSSGTWVLRHNARRASLEIPGKGRRAV